MGKKKGKKQSEKGAASNHVDGEVERKEGCNCPVGCVIGEQE